MITIVKLGGPASIQDAGRPGRMHEGVPPGGALAPGHLAAANLALGNPPDAPAVEHHGRIVVSADAPIVAATAFELVELGPAPVTLEPRLRAGILAVPGGLDAPLVLGGRGALPGQLLRAGDRLRARGGLARPIPPRPPASSEDPVRVILGPDPADTAALLAADFTISPLGDRVGVRLAGPRLDAAPLSSSAPMVRGAIQATPSGELVVLGPDHPTTGGYPVVAVVVSADLERLLLLRPGAHVRFRAA
jgi:allophanate hydrolase subunit 2